MVILDMVRLAPPYIPCGGGGSSKLIKDWLSCGAASLLSPLSCEFAFRMSRKDSSLALAIAFRSSADM